MNDGAAVTPAPAGAVNSIPDALDPQLDPQEVARLAYSFWLERGCEPGQAEQDWYRAEAQLRASQAGCCQPAREITMTAGSGV
jgi:hypothetical protein